MRVLVTGGTGYLGGAIVPALQGAGHTVRVLARPGGRDPGGLGPVEVVRGDVVRGEGLEEAVRDCGAVVHLVGVLRAPRGLTQDAVHAGGTRHMVAAAAHAGVRRVLYVSALGAAPDGPTPYLRAKAAAEAALVASGLEYAILRAAVVFGPGGPGMNFVRTLQDLVRSAPVTPVLGDGQSMLQPVAAPDLAGGCAALLGAPAGAGRVFDVGGPERLPYIEVLRRVAGAMGRPFRPLRVPLGLVRAVLPVMERVPGFPLDRDQLAMLLDSPPCDAAPFWTATGITPQRFSGR
jgi:NADH dehydrogenase